MQVVRPELPPWVETVVRRALAKVPADRYPSAQVLARELSGTSGTWHAPGLLEGLRKRKVPLAAVGGVVVAVVGLARWLESRPALRRHDWVLVADFQGPADDPTLAPAVRDLTTAELDQSTYMRTLPRHQLNTAMRLAGVPETTFVDPPLARQLALRSSVRALILGNVQRIGEGSYSIALHAVRASDGADLHSVAAAASDADLVTSVQSLGRELRASLGDRRSDIEATRPLRDVATPSFEAYRRYSQALNVAGAGGDLGGANELLREAVAIDTAFASAWAAMGSNYVTARQLDSARDAFEHALAFPSRLTDANRYRLQGDVAYAIHHDVPAAVRWYDLYLEEVPHSRSGRGNRAVYLSALGRYEEAVADLREAVDANPFGPEVAQGTILNLAAALVVVGRVEEAERAAADLTGPFARYVDILVALARSDWVAVGSLAAIVDTMSRPPTFLRIHARTARASALAARGAVGAADSLLGAVAEASSGAEARWYRHAQLLLAVVSERAPWPDTAGESVPDARTPARTLRALWAAADGDSLRARNELGDPSTWTYLDSAAVGNSPDVVEALIAGKAANWHAVVTRLGAAARHGEHDPTFLDRPTSLMTRWLVADAYGRMNELDSSVSLLERIVAARDMPPGHFALRGIPYAFTLRRLALAYGRLGDRDSATRCWRTFLETTTTPDSIMQRLSDDARRTLALPGRLP
jgi:tetratricopeptide (TPR) repeat protein